jgi:hypothetical protein
MTLEDLEKLKNAGLIRGYTSQEPIKTKKRSKYGNVKTQVDGIVFDSIKEANRYISLRFLLKSGGIKYLERQVEFELNEGGPAGSIIYRADFVYELDGKMIVEDVKGHRTREYKRKRKLMLQCHGIEIHEY